MTDSLLGSRVRRALPPLLLLSLSWLQPAAAQDAHPHPLLPVLDRTVDESLPSALGPAAFQEPESPLGPGYGFLASFVLPGSSQWLQGQRRAYMYAGLELAAWATFLQGRHQGAQYRDRYRDLAWAQARAHPEEGRIEGDFRYYEALGEYLASGAWDADRAAEGLQPETDPETFNGSVWELATQLFLAGEEGSESDSESFRRALEYYQERSFPPEMSWDWSGNESGMEEYRRLIERSDDGFRRATVVLGAVVANHLLSAVDGFVSARIASEPSPLSALSRSDPSWMPARRWTLELRFEQLP